MSIDRARVAQLHAQGHAPSTIANFLGCALSSVVRALAATGQHTPRPVAPHGRGPRRPLPAEQVALIARFQASKQVVSSLAPRLGLAEDELRRYLSGIKAMPPALLQALASLL